MGRINTNPLGLLDLLQSKTDGVNPSDLAESVAPTLDMTPFYISEKMGHAFSVVSTATIGNQSEISVPAGEVFSLFAVDINFVANAINNFVSLEVEIQSIPKASSTLNAVAILATGVLDGPLVGDRATAAVVFNTPIFMPPGSKLTTTVLSRSGSFNVSTNIGVYRLLI